MGKEFTWKEKEELGNILSAMICISFEEEVKSICFYIDLINKQLKEMIINNLNIPLSHENECLDILLENISTIYKLYLHRQKKIENVDAE